jgi:hypothetical protein
MPEPPSMLPHERHVIGALPRSETMEVRFKVHGYNLAENGFKVSDHSEFVTLRELPDIIRYIEIWYGDFMIACMPLAMGGGYWIWIPPTEYNNEETEEGNLE